MKSGGAFRIRRVFEWLGTDGHENIRITGGLAEGNGRILSIDKYVSRQYFAMFSDFNASTARSRLSKILCSLNYLNAIMIK